MQRAASGLLVIGGGFLVVHRRIKRGIVIVDREYSPNLVVDQGVNYVLNTAINGAAQVPTWYVGIFKNNYTPLASDTLAGGFVTSAGEAAASTDYSQASRVTYTEAASTAKSITNSASPATFTILTTFTAYGAFLCSAASGTTGTLLAAAKFSTSKSVSNTDELDVTYTINGASS